MGTLAELLGTLDLDPRRRGKQFEHICGWFLANDPVYRSQLRHVWMWDEWPERWGPDAGIDLVAEDRGGHLWAIQAKAYAATSAITKKDVDTFLSESARADFAFRLLIATTDRIGATADRTLRDQEKPVGRLLLGDLQRAQVTWPRSPSEMTAAPVQPAQPRPHQRRAVSAVVEGFEHCDRGQMIMACGTGKTLTSLFIAERLHAKRILVLVPSLSLLADTVRAWTANGNDLEFLPVCSDDTVSDPDAAVSTVTEMGFPVTTDPAIIASFLDRGSGRQAVFATYQSSPKIASAFERAGLPPFDLVIADEAHRCAGRVSSEFATVLDPDAIPAERRLFMTATPRFFTGRLLREAKEADLEVASMDDETRFGPVFHRLGFAEAIDLELLTDYQLVIVGVDDATFLEWAQHGHFVTLDGTEVTDARTVAGQIGLAKAMKNYDLRRTISFHSRVKRARDFAGTMPRVIDWMPSSERPSGRLWAHVVSSSMPAGKRSTLLDRLRHVDQDERGLLANARCLGEGIDVPALDGVAFIDPRASEVDIIQAVGRAIRLSEDKRVGTIVLPVFIRAGDDPNAVLDASAFKPVWGVIKALRAHDEQLGEELDALRRERGRQAQPLRTPTKIHLDLPARIGSAFLEAFNVRLVEETTADWEFWFGLLQAFADREGHVRPPTDHLEQGYQLGEWVSGQRKYKEKGVLSPDRVSRLQEMPEWTWDARSEWWENGFEHLQQFVEREGHAQVPRRLVDESGFGLGEWAWGQCQTFARGKLAPDRIARLEALPDWKWSTRPKLWEEGFDHLSRFVEREGHARVPHDHTEDGYRLGQWVTSQRTRTARDSSPRGLDRIARLDALPGWTWDARGGWDDGIRKLYRFAEREGHTYVPRGSAEDGFDLHKWVQRQQDLYARGRLGLDRAVRLEAVLHWSWEAETGRPEATRRQSTRQDPKKWEQGFEHLCRFVQREGHARVPMDCVEDGFRLGNWVSAQRHRERLTDDRASRLESLPGWSWDPRADRWDNAYRELQGFAAREGHARVRLDHVERDYRLGWWVKEQRSMFLKGRLSIDRAARLEAIPGWTWDIFDEKWEEGFEHLCRFSEREGHAQVPAKHIEDDGYRLGSWVNTQRSRYRIGKVSAGRVSRLEGVPGWVWSMLRSS